MLNDIAEHILLGNVWLNFGMVDVHIANIIKIFQTLRAIYGRLYFWEFCESRPCEDLARKALAIRFYLTLFASVC